MPVSISCREILVAEKIAKLFIVDMQFGNLMAGFTSHVVLNKDPTVWLDRAWPANLQNYIWKY